MHYGTTWLWSQAPELCRLGAGELASAYRAGEFSPADVAQACLVRALTMNAELNAFTFVDEKGALAQARASEARWRAGQPLSPIDGVPATLKDIVWVKGWPVHYGSRAGAISECNDDAPSVQRLRAAGAVFLGQTTTPEFGWKAVTDSPRFGNTLNPWDLSLTPGGSSGGAAVAAACGAGVLHLGTDGGGSIRIPAAFSGITGLKPTFGRVPAYPASVFGTVAHIGPMARRVADLAAMLPAMSGRDLRDWPQGAGALDPVRGNASLVQMDGLKLALWRKPASGHVDAAIDSAFSAAVDRLVASGAVLGAYELPPGDWLEVFHLHWFSGAACRLDQLTKEQLATVDEGMLAVHATASNFSAARLVAAQSKRAGLGMHIEQALQSCDVIISPAVGIEPFEAGREVPAGTPYQRWTEWAGFSYPVNLGQQPACVIPMGLTRHGKPCGLQIIGARGKDQHVLDVAASIERILQSDA
jgi:amidase/aspartyl-tRNA(Asn)/glutamyl-tRNA(Gln) amidotransferase subunit A